MRFILFMFYILTVSFLPTLRADEQKVTQEVDSTPIPNPLELQSDWWNYFNVPVEKLPERIESFEKYLNNFLSFYTEKNPEIVTEKQDIFQNLELFKKTISQIAVKELSPPQLLESYSLNQILEVNQKILELQNEIEQVKDKISFKNTRLSWFQSKLDKQVIYYYQLPPASTEKLLVGLQVIENRIEVAIHKSEVDYLSSTLIYYLKEKDQLAAEIKTAKEKISYTAIDKESLSKELDAIQKNIEKAQIRLKELEKKMIQQDLNKVKNQILNEVLYYKIIAETINIENLNVLSTLTQIKITLYDIAENEKSSEPETIRDSLRKWEKELSTAKQQSLQWEKQLENDHFQATKTIQEKLKENADGSSVAQKTISDIHLEIDQCFSLIENIQFNISGAELLIKLLESRFVQEKSFSEYWSILAKNRWSKFTENVKEKMNYSLFYVKDRPISIGTLLKSILTIILAVIFSKFFRKVLFKNIFSSGRFSKSTRYVVLRLLHYIIILLAVLIALSFLGIDLTTLAIVLGVLGVGIGFGLQSIATNVITGFAILFHRYLKVGDVVELGGELGVILGMNLQFTHIRSSDGSNQIIPNSEIFNRDLKNWTMHNSYRRYRVPFRIAHGTNKENLKKVLLETVQKESYVLTGLTKFSDPEMWFIKYGDSSIEFELVAWVNLDIKPPQGTHPSSLLWVIDKVLYELKITTPFPQHDLYVKEFPKMDYLK